MSRSRGGVGDLVTQPQWEEEGGAHSQRSPGPPVRGLVGTFFLFSDVRSRTFAHVPAAAASDVARLCGLDGHMHMGAVHMSVLVLVRSKTREGLLHGARLGVPRCDIGAKQRVTSA